jgi:hypothetical protein
MDVITGFGVTCDPLSSHQLETGIGRAVELLYSLSPVPMGFLGWILSKAPLDRLHGLRFCFEDGRENAPSIGMLLYYIDGSRRALGQFRWDRQITETIFRPVIFQYRNRILYGKSYVYWRWSSEKYGNGRGGGDTEIWNDLLEHGVVEWWTGNRGNHIGNYSKTSIER